jgi:UDP-GlcNAc:undecaprenyl-phosphate GlcNAc-1-phosphate transferase
MTILPIISSIFAFAFTYFLVPYFRKAASYLQLVDKPNYRKVHATPIPLVGGIAVFFGIMLALKIAFPFEIDLADYNFIFKLAGVLLFVGVLDDRFDLRASLKLAIQLVLAHLVFMQGIKIESLHGLWGIYELAPWLQYGLTVLVIAGTVNAFNLMDGIDGLAAGLAIIGFSVYAILAAISGQATLVIVFVTFIGALTAFLRFNLSKNNKIFMGDAGSLMLGFVLVVFGIHMLQEVNASEHITLVTLGVIAVLLLPVLDALRVFRKRAKSGKSPFQADKTHLHHLILATGLKHLPATLAIVTLMVMLLTLGYFSFHIMGLTLAFVSMLLTFYVITGLLSFHNQMKCWVSQIRQMEKQ